MDTTTDRLIDIVGNSYVHPAKKQSILLLIGLVAYSVIASLDWMFVPFFLICLGVTEFINPMSLVLCNVIKGLTCTYLILRVLNNPNIDD